MPEQLIALSPLDGRYREKVEELRAYFSEAALIHYRIAVEVEWLVFLCNGLNLAGTKKIPQAKVKKLRNLYQKDASKHATEVKKIEKTTNHDVKAVEYFLQRVLEKLGLDSLVPFIHFSCTSEDINNLSHALMIKDALEYGIGPSLVEVRDTLFLLGQLYSEIPMLSLTHGQPASPTTVGKELTNVVARLDRQLESLVSVEILGKMNGAVGNFNAHSVAYPKVNWINASEKFIKSLGLIPNLYTTQIEPHDYMAELFDALRRINTILIDLDRDLWAYISRGYFKQKPKKGEVGSSTMPHKVNPIDFENSEGNLGLANAIFSHLSEKLPISRLQRDLTDSTVIRNVGTAFGYSLLAYKSTLNGLAKLTLDGDALLNDLADNPEVLAEPIQMVMRKNKIKDAYEQLKELTRGKEITPESMKKFIGGLDIAEADKKRLRKLKPYTYTGAAAKLVRNYKR